VLELCREIAAEEPGAALVLARWSDWRSACERQASKRERRFRRRAYQRARDRALGVLLMRTQAPGTGGERRLQRPRAQPRRQISRLGVLLRQHGRRTTARR
jgi:hypothetical protein